MRRVPRLHVITDEARLASARFVEDAAAVLEAGGAHVALHLRGRTTEARRLFDLATALLPVARATGAVLIVNDRVDVALTARADGVQLREDSLDVAHARVILGEAALIGVSRHVGSEAAVDGADFVLFGAIWPTASHPGRTPAGLRALSEFGARAGLQAQGSGASGVRRQASETAVRLIGIGGITPVRVAEVMAAGAYGVAVLSGIWGVGTKAVHDYVAALKRHAVF
ncbi:MAG TPA: thiamine phosphate synthase [Longimicrobiales bacterium]